MDIVGVDMGGIKFRVECCVRGGEDRGNGAWVIVQKHINKEEKSGGIEGFFEGIL